MELSLVLKKKYHYHHIENGAAVILVVLAMEGIGAVIRGIPTV